jgi:hypothetical protein
MLVGALSGLALWPIAIVAIDLNLFFSIKYSTSGVPPPLVSGAVFMVLTVVTLALTFRRAFGRR